jgi:hypothetical protein
MYCGRGGARRSRHPPRRTGLRTRGSGNGQHDNLRPLALAGEDRLRRNAMGFRLLGVGVCFSLS